MSIKPKKSLGQHFLTDGNIIRKIVDSVEPEDGNAIVEIGPGTGALTAELFKRFPQLEVIEIDSRAVEYLQNTWPALKIHQTDVLETSWDDFIENRTSGENNISKYKISLVGNLPYYITSPILFSVLDRRELFQEVVIMIQKEVAERLIAKKRTKDYGILSVQTQLLAQPEYLFTVSRHVFNPKPNVESAVVKLRFDRPAPDVNLNNLKKVVRMAFGQRRKTLSNSLKTLLVEQFPDEDLRKKLTPELGLQRRAEELEPGEFVTLTKRIMGA